MALELHFDQIMYDGLQWYLVSTKRYEHNKQQH